MGPFQVAMDSSLRILTVSPGETQRLGEVIGKQAQPGDVYLLTGPLGAGKTCLTQGIGRGLDVPGYVRSPTFVLMSRHQGRLVLHHMDLYRIADSSEAWDLALDEQILGEDVCVVEWADRAAELFPAGCCWISLDYGTEGNHRTVTLSITSTRYTRALQSLAVAFPEAEKVTS